MVSAELIEVVNEYGSELFRHLSGLHSIIVTVDKHGIIYVGPDDALDSKMVLGPCSNLFNNNEKVRWLFLKNSCQFKKNHTILL